MEEKSGGGKSRSRWSASSSPLSDIGLPSRTPTPNGDDELHHPGSNNSTIRVGGYPDNNHGVENAKKSTGSTSATGQPPQRHSNSKSATTETKVKKPRKKPEPKPEAEKKEKPVRKPRKSTSTATNPNPRKKQKTENASSPANVKSEPVAASRQTKITDLVTPTQSLQQPPQTTEAPATTQQSQSGNSEAITKIQAEPPPSSPQPQPTAQPAPPVRVGGTNYDPIRSSFLTTSSNPPSQPIPSPSRPPPSRASESPALASLMNPQPISEATTSGAVSYPQLPRTASTESHPSKPLVSSPSNRHIILDPTPPAQSNQPSKPAPEVAQKEGPPSVMSVDSDPAPQPAAKPAPVVKKTTSGNSSTAPSPKPPVRAKDIVPPLPSGSGLITSALFGGSSDATSTTVPKASPNIVLEVPLLGQSNKVVNFARLAEEKYGFAALHPRVAAQRERLARVALASAALERNNSASKKGNTDSAAENESAEGDDMSLDLESDNDGDVAMSGFGGGGDNSGGEGTGTGEDQAKKKKAAPRRKKIEEYDRDDPFVDDSEMAWEATAAASKDGFFVYYGPLIQEGEKPSLEKYVYYSQLPFPSFACLANNTFQQSRWYINQLSNHSKGS